jgi:hypothetical protein
MDAGRIACIQVEIYIPKKPREEADEVMLSVAMQSRLAPLHLEQRSEERGDRLKCGDWCSRDGGRMGRGCGYKLIMVPAGGGGWVGGEREEWR